jgi:hypothetical protein
VLLQRREQGSQVYPPRYRVLWSEKGKNTEFHILLFSNLTEFILTLHDKNGDRFRGTVNIKTVAFELLIRMQPKQIRVPFRAPFYRQSL